jgi:hypothetical protein
LQHTNDEAQRQHLVQQIVSHPVPNVTVNRDGEYGFDIFDQGKHGDPLLNTEADDLRLVLKNNTRKNKKSEAYLACGF